MSRNILQPPPPPPDRHDMLDAHSSDTNESDSYLRYRQFQWALKAANSAPKPILKAIFRRLKKYLTRPNKKGASTKEEDE